MSKRILSNRKLRGQTLFIAILILTVLAVLGFVFLGIINRNIIQAATQRKRSQSTVLAEAGIQYAHGQLLYSSDGGDWLPIPTPVAPTVEDPNFSRDADLKYIRPGTGFPLRTPGDYIIDQGGPDGLGPFTRVSFQDGRALVRVRYGPSDASIFHNDPAGPLREPGAARMYFIIESVGRPGQVVQNDPTTIGSGPGVKFQSFVDEFEFRQSYQEMISRDTLLTQSRKLIAFATTGIIDNARFIHNIHHSSRPIEIGVPDELGARFGADAILPPILMGILAAPGVANVSLGGSVYINGDVIIHGTTKAVVNRSFGEAWKVAGTITAASDISQLLLSIRNGDNSDLTGDQDVVIPAAGLNSRGNFDTYGGSLRDGLVRTDAAGNPRAISWLEAPAITATDPSTGLNRYISLTRDSGKELNGVSTGRFAHGRGVYVNNLADRQVRRDEAGREEHGSEESLPYDWLNPNNGQALSGWRGPFYTPPGAYVLLAPDGFVIFRDQSGPVEERTWKNPDGSDSGLSQLVFRIGGDSDPAVAGDQPYIINTLTPNANIDAQSPNWSEGIPFNGVLYFEGNVRIRGEIPTDVQLTLVSMGTIYVEGSITKGIVDVKSVESSGVYKRLTRPSRSMLMLMAREYVALNTSQFIGLVPGSGAEEVNEDVSAVAWKPIRMRASDDSLNLMYDMPLDPESDSNPELQITFPEEYRQFDPGNPNTNTGATIDTQLLLTHTMDDGPAAYSFFSLDVNFGLGAAPTYQFELDQYNSATPFYPSGTTNAPIYGLGEETWQRYGKFESRAYPFIRPATATFDQELITATGNEGTYEMLIQDTNILRFRPNGGSFGATNDYLLARAALVPFNVRIEASMYAQEGSFFVIPGQYFNPQPNDTRLAYEASSVDPDERDQIRLDNYGAFPQMPFYGEPIDMRVEISGAISENLPPPISQQAEWLRKWGWIPMDRGATGEKIPWVHVPANFNVATEGANLFIPNLTITYDQVLATSRAAGFAEAGNPYIRTDRYGRALPPLPKMPVSSTLAYYGEVNP